MNLHLLFPYHLNLKLATFRGFDPTQDRVLLIEAPQFFREPRHHQKKIVFLISAMRHFAKELQQAGIALEYRALRSLKALEQIKKTPLSHFSVLPTSSWDRSFIELLEEEIERLTPKKLIFTRPADHHQMARLIDLGKRLQLPLEMREDDFFFSTPAEFEEWTEGRKELRMEFFYREMRRRHQILMERGKKNPKNQPIGKRDQPIGGQWNYDTQNRKPPKGKLTIPPPYTNQIDPITQEAIEIVQTHFKDHFGKIEPFYFALSRAEALEALELFITERLPNFGDYQDAMLEGEAWMYHSHLSFYLNTSLLHPQECVAAAEVAYHEGKASLNAVEGFIRQILGWREYIRGIYWSRMPAYKNLNFLEARRPLPRFFWNGQTKMNCLHQAIKETEENAYAHHIQRLMVIGNFLLLLGVAPEEVNEWYLIVYADAFEWVELPNVTGMILFADGGILGSKPYAAGGNYIHKMSNYCTSCYYNVKEKEGKRACPFNYLYWNFLMQHEKKLSANRRLAMPYVTLKKMSPEKKESLRTSAQDFYWNLG